VIAAICLLAWTGPGIPPDTVIARLEQWTARQQQKLPSYQGRRRYFVSHPLLKGDTYEVVEERYRPPEEKQFQVLERRGAPAVASRVFDPLMEAERVTARDPERAATEICRRNYRFQFQAYDPDTRAYIFTVEPRTPNRYLFRGKIWVDERDFAVRRIEGEPAQRLSPWVRTTRFVHEFGKFGNFWLPVRHRSEVDLVLLGPAVMGIDYFEYQGENFP
jgi:hypothetical protein